MIRATIVLLLPTLLLACLLSASPLSLPPLCNNALLSTVNISTPVGTALGLVGASGTLRLAVRYATAKRWEESTVATSWNLPPGAANAGGSPLACPQPGLSPSQYSEDCLAMVIYVPQGVKSGANTLLWIHGGSFLEGSASDPALDGSRLATATGSVVAVVQYRLGALGFMPPNGNTNLAVKDIINAMKFLQSIAPSLGGSSTITLAGQSSGANMIRALLATPSASSLFKSGILHSDPMDYGFLSSSTQTKLQSAYNSLISCSASDTKCWNSLSLDQILNTEMSLCGSAQSIDPSTGQGEPIRPVLDGSLITSPLDSTASFPAVSKPLMISTVVDDAGPAIFGQFTSPLPENAFQPICEASLGPDRTATILNSSFYQPIPYQDGTIDARDQLQVLGTDQMWRCASWTFARNWAQHGGEVYVGVYTVGATYSDNEGIPFCTQSGHVCHEDDIMIVFGTVSNPTSSQSALITEVQKRYRSFMSTGNPNTSGLPAWSAVSGSTVNTYNLGGTAAIAVGGCETSFWGQSVPFDYQVYDI